MGTMVLCSHQSIAHALLLASSVPLPAEGTSRLSEHVCTSCKEWQSLLALAHVLDSACRCSKNAPTARACARHWKRRRQRSRSAPD